MIIENAELPKFKRTRKKTGFNPARKYALDNNERFYQGTECKFGHNGLRWAVDGHCKECKAIMRRQPKTLAAIQRGGRKYELKKFGMIEEDYQKLLISQNYVCSICKKPETVKLKSGEIKRLAVDHCHDKGTVRGLLCYACNIGIGLLRHNPEILNKAAIYCSQI